MADGGRCTTLFESGRIFNDSIYTQAGIQVSDNLAYRRYLQNSTPEDIIPAPTCSLYSYVKDFDIIESTNVISQNEPKD